MTADTRQLTSLATDLTKAAKNVQPVASAAVRKTAADIIRDAQIAAPVRTGNLRNSITADITDYPAVVSAEVGPTAEYGAYVEFGTSKQAPQPYLGPAADRHVPVLETALTRLLTQGLP
ncbi:HK97 gp10 family phage protein [Brevibacterium sp. p3-SID960]|uniref:HK97-gp10 family putative phage morphogenesis protein n=1 Tax=Brevibacterium sp. p3-SID960 TaxID=2916063 RepID=UPI0021A2FAD0|nr:HK97-gp10 family putative phage morphogenesis protein [Brevibacterium sp. p3-SID960]MCT1689868.1 HK97 gp10 family phage protein [Brevibacterium sp. p3-SID960]